MDRKNYGNNVTLKWFKRHYVIGIGKDIKLVFLMVLSYWALFTGWIACIYSFYSFYFIVICGLLFILVIWYYLICFLTEPGIIPRRYHTFMILSEGNNEQNASSNAGKTTGSGHVQIKASSHDNSLCAEGNSNNASVIGNTSLMNNSLLINDDNKKTVVNIFPEITELKDQQGPNHPVGDKKDKEASDAHNNSLIFVPKEEENTSTTPSIFQNRHCATCEINRPPKASHCKICDNCIMNLDHHCFYISNCVGERNHCFFLLFLLFGSILSWVIMLTSSYHLTYIIFFYPDNISLVIVKSNYIELIAACILLLISLLLLCMKCIPKKYALVPALMGYILFLYAFMVNFIKANIKGAFKHYYHPFSSLIIILLSPMACFVNSNLLRQFKTLSRGLTIKQYESITKESKEMAKKGKSLNTTALNPITYSQRLTNIWAFLINKRSISLLNR